ASAIFDGEPSEIVPTLLILDDWSLLERLVAAWDMASLEQIFLAIDRTNGVQDKELLIEDLIAIASLFLGRFSILGGIDPSGNLKLGEKKLALKLFLGQARESDWRSAGTPSPWKIYRALRLLDALLDFHASVAAARRQLQLAADGLYNGTVRSEDSILS